MIYWIKKLSYIAAGIAFCLVFAFGLNRDNPFDTASLLLAIVKGGFAAALFWFLGFIICDTALKGIVEDIPSDYIDPLEGGLAQHIMDVHSKPKISDDFVPEPRRERKK